MAKEPVDIGKATSEKVAEMKLNRLGWPHLLIERDIKLFELAQLVGSDSFEIAGTSPSITLYNSCTRRLVSKVSSPASQVLVRVYTIRRQLKTTNTDVN